MQSLKLDSNSLKFSLDLSFKCGQIFFWEKNDDIWTGILSGKNVCIKQDGDTIFWSGAEEKDIILFLGLDQNIPEILKDIKSSIIAYRKTNDEIFDIAVNFGSGLRLFRQDPYECLISFICSANSNIPTIGKRITLLSKMFGLEVSDSVFSFPLPEILGEAEEDEIRQCSTGYRAPYLKKTACFITKNPDFLKSIEKLPYIEAKESLMQLSGVGPKVADCILLFAYGKYEAVPVDVWIKKIIIGHYSQFLDEGKMSYNEMGNFCRRYFGKYAGYAQQYMYTARNEISGLIKD